MKLERRYNLDAPKGVRGRNSDNTLILERSAGNQTSRYRSVWRRRTPGSTTSWRPPAPPVAPSSPADALSARTARGRTPVISVILYGRNDSHGYNLHRARR